MTDWYQYTGPSGCVIDVATPLRPKQNKSVKVFFNEGHVAPIKRQVHSLSEMQ